MLPPHGEGAYRSKTIHSYSKGLGFVGFRMGIRSLGCQVSEVSGFWVFGY